MRTLPCQSSSFPLRGGQKGGGEGWGRAGKLFPPPFPSLSGVSLPTGRFLSGFLKPAYDPWNWPLATPPATPTTAGVAGIDMLEILQYNHIKYELKHFFLADFQSQSSLFVCIAFVRKKIYTTLYIIWFQYSQDVLFIFTIFSLAQKNYRNFVFEPLKNH